MAVARQSQELPEVCSSPVRVSPPSKPMTRQSSPVGLSPPCKLMPRLPLSGPLRRRPCALSHRTGSVSTSPEASPMQASAGSTGGLLRLPLPPLSPPSPGTGEDSPSSPTRPPAMRSMWSPTKLSHCKSAPTVVGSDTGLSALPFGGTVYEAERHRQQVMFSPQGLFARSVPPGKWGAHACKRFHQLGLEDTRRSNAETHGGTSSRPSSGTSTRSGCDRDRSLSPRRLSKDSMLSRPASSKTEDNEDTWSFRRSSVNPAQGSRVSRMAVRDAATFRQYQNRRDCFDFREGLRVAILGTKPAPLGADKIWPPPNDDRKMATREETFKVYKQYNEWVRMQQGDKSEEGEDQFVIAVDNSAAAEGGICLSATVDHSTDGRVRVRTVSGGPLADWNTSCEADDTEDRLVRTGDCILEVNGFRGLADEMVSRCAASTLLHLVLERPRKLVTIGWNTFNNWLYMKVVLANSPREKAVYNSMAKAHKAYLKYQMRYHRRHHGLTLTALIRWVWPSLRPTDIANMYTWLCLGELDSIRVDTPRVINKDARRQIEGIFQEMDWGKKGVLTPTDFAGGENQDITALLKNCVDETTVQKVLGEGSINLTRFMELMCEDNCRGHPDATEAILGDGRYIKEEVRRSVPFRGWVYRDVPKEEQFVRRRIDALEEEVKMWRLIARGRVREREMDKGPMLLS